MKLLTLLSLMLLAAMPEQSTASINVAGTIGTVTWTAAESPYYLADSVTVADGATLTIEPGVDVISDSASACLVVLGSLNAIGTESDSIRFLPGDNGWRGIVFVDGDGEMAYTRVSGVVEPASFTLMGDDHLYTQPGIKVDGSEASLILSNSIVERNGQAGIDMTNGATATITDCAIRNNYATLPNGAGVEVRRGAVASFVDCEFVGNVDESRGGGAMIEFGGVAEFERCLFANNSCRKRGPGLYVMSATARLTNCTIVGNTDISLPGEQDDADIFGGLFFTSVTSGDPTWLNVTNTIVYGNQGNQIGNSFPLGSFNHSYVVIDHSIVDGGWDGDSNLDVDPLLNSDYTLQSTSPAIDAGSPYVLDVDESASDIGFTGGVLANPALPRLELNTTTIVVGTEPLADTLVVSNSGMVDLVIESISLPDVFVTSVTFPQTIPPGGTLLIPITAVGTASGSYALEIASSDAYRSSVTVSVEAPVPTAMSPATPVAATRLYQNAPNPFNPSTTIGLDIADPSDVTLAVYDLNGRLVRTLHSGVLSTGRYEFTWNGEDAVGRGVASGVYFYRLRTVDEIQTRRMMLIR